MVEVRINAKVRTGKSGSYKHYLRESGRIPAVIYGNGISSEPIELDAKELETVIHKNGRNALIDLIVNGKQGDNKYVVMVKDIQRDPIRRELVHADLCKISLQDKIHTTVPIILKGDAEGHKMGGIVQTGLREAAVECIPANIPESLSVDVSNLKIGDHLTVADLPTTPDCRILNDSESIIVTIVAPRMAEQPETIGAEGPAVAPAKPGAEAHNPAE